MHIYLLICLLITHVFIDATSGAVNPILERLADKYQTPDIAMGLVAALLFSSASFSQLLFGYIYDRFRAYWLIPLAILVGGTCLGCIGLVDSFALLLVLSLLTGLAIGVFHPGGTALAGSLAVKWQYLGIAVFLCAGALGGAASPLLISRLVDAQGLEATAWIFVPTIPAFLIALILFRRYRRILVSKNTSARQGTFSAAGLFSRSMVLLFCIVTSRTFALMVIITGMSFLMSEKIDSRAILSTGNILFWFSLAIGFGGLLSGTFIRPESEKPGILISLMIGGPLLIAFPMLPKFWLLLAIVTGGLAFGSTIPLIPAIGQRLLPNSSATASSILMGLAWGTAHIAAPLTITWLGPLISYRLAMPLLIAVGMLVALAATLILPPVIRPQTGSRLAAEPIMP